MVLFASGTLEQKAPANKHDRQLSSIMWSSKLRIKSQLQAIIRLGGVPPICSAPLPLPSLFRGHACNLPTAVVSVYIAFNSVEIVLDTMCIVIWKLQIKRGFLTPIGDIVTPHPNSRFQGARQHTYSRRARSRKYRALVILHRSDPLSCTGR